MPANLPRVGPPVHERGSDRFGNLQLAARLQDLEPAGLAGPERLEVTAGDQVILARPVRTFGELRSTEAGITVDSAGFLALVVNGGSTALAFGLGSGDEVRLARPA